VGRSRCSLSRCGAGNKEGGRDPHKKVEGSQSDPSSQTENSDRQEQQESQPSYSKIPQNLPRSGIVKFVGRTQKLQELHAQLQQNDRIAITAIAGMGGIGKTELALQYAIAQLKQGHYPAGLCWLRARDQEIATQIVTFAQAHLGLTPPDKLEIETQVRFCWQQWPEGEALVILDDLTDYKAIEPYLPPPDPRFKLLITTRLKLGRSVEEFLIEELDEDNAIALLESLAGRDRIQSQMVDAKALCTWVGSLPLALELLGRFLARKPDWTINRLLKALDDKRLDANALIAPESGMTAKLGVAAALELSWQELNEAEQELACVLGMFAISPIPWSLVEQCLPEVDPDDLEDTRDNGLLARSLLKRVGEGSYQLHQIVQEYFRIKLELRSEQGHEIKSSFCGVMVAISLSIEERPTTNQIEQVIGAITHLEEATIAWLGWIPKKELFLTVEGIRRFHSSQGYYNLATSAYIKSVENLKILLGQEHPDVIQSLNNLGLLYIYQGNYRNAEELLMDVLHRRRKLLPQEHPDTAQSLNNLALLYRHQGRYEEAELLLIEALRKRDILEIEQLDISSHSNITPAIYFNQNLALIYYQQGRYEEAEPLFIEALKNRIKNFGKESPDVAQTFNNLALIYYHQMRHEEAEPLFIEALEMRKKILGQDHPDIAQSLNNLARLYFDQERCDEAEPLFIEALEMRKKVLGQEHPHVGSSLNNLGELYRQQGHYDKAQSLLLSSLELWKKCLGQEHPDIAISLRNLGNLYQQQGKYVEAQFMFLEAIKIAEAKLGSNHPTTQSIRHQLDSFPQTQ
jgi:tetratricopeptide (TPR) repeat protein